MNHSRFSASLPLVVVGLVACVGGFLPSSLEIIRSAVFLFVLVFAAGALSHALAPRLPRAVRWLVSGGTILAGQAILQTAWYYAGGTLNALADGLGLGGSILVIGLLVHLQTTTHHETERTPAESIKAPEATWSTLALLSFVSAVLFLLVTTALRATTASINSPWNLFPGGTFIAIAVLFASSFLASLKSRTLIVVACVGGTLLALASLTPLLYPLGYGFDGFLHRASEAVILETGTLTPAPPSYIGQYTFITWLSRVLRIPHTISDLWFVGALGLLLPLAATQLGTKRRGLFTIVSLLLVLPLNIFSATTPQNVAYVLGVLALLWLIPSEQEETTPLVVPGAFLGWSLATHPLAGLPFAFAGVAILAQRLKRRWLAHALTGLSLLGSLLAVPLAFSLRAFLQTGNWSWNWLRTIPSSLGWFVNRLTPPATHLALWPDWANWQVYLLTFFLLGAALFAVTQDLARRKYWLSLITLSFTAIGSSWLLQLSGDFSFLISYERQDYAGRLLIVAQLFLIPAAIVGLGYWFERIERTHPRMRAAALLFALAWFSANVYNMLPRNDAAAIGHGWNVGRSDVEAVKFIDKQASGQDYTVLANQTVSAAAISEFGFKRYVGDVFFYPIPTGGPLYEQFLQMMNRPDRDIAQEAATLGQSKLVYVVVNQYWFKSEQIIERLKAIADRTWNVERGTAYIFLFDFTTFANSSTTRSGT